MDQFPIRRSISLYQLPYKPERPVEHAEIRVVMLGAVHGELHGFKALHEAL